MSKPPESQTDDLARVLAKKIQRARYHTRLLDRTLGLDRAVDFDRARILVEELTKDLDLAFHLISDSDIAIRENDRILDLVAALDRSRGIANEIIRDEELAWVVGNDCVHPLASVVGQCMVAVGRLVQSLDAPATALTSRSTPKAGSHQPGKVVHLLVAASCLVLPPGHRARYAPEFHSELFELPRRRRFGHAIRILRSAPAIRASLRSSKREV